MRVALYQCYKCHTEVLGFLLCALNREGHEAVIYNEPAADASSFVHFYEQLFGRPLEIRPCHALFSNHKDFDMIVMATADDPMCPKLVREFPEKFVVIQHEQGWHRTSVLPCHMGLSPYVSSPFMFPVYDAAFAPNNSVNVPARSKHLHLAIVGHVSESKHLEEISAFLEFSTHTRLSFLSRAHTFFVHTILANPANKGRVRVMNNLPTNELMMTLGDDDVDAIWVPIRKNAEHSMIKLTGALPLAYNLRKRVIVPDMIADDYRLEGAVVYTSGVEGLLDLLNGWDAITKDDWDELSRRASAFVTRTVETNREILSRMLLQQGSGAVSVDLEEGKT